MPIESDLDPIHTQRLAELSAKLNQPLAEILAAAIDTLYQRESADTQAQEAAIRRLRSRYAHIPPHISLADELIGERRREATRESQP